MAGTIWTSTYPATPGPSSTGRAFTLPVIALFMIVLPVIVLPVIVLPVIVLPVIVLPATVLFMTVLFMIMLTVTVLPVIVPLVTVLFTTVLLVTVPFTTALFVIGLLTTDRAAHNRAAHDRAAHDHAAHDYAVHNRAVHDRGAVHGRAARVGRYGASCGYIAHLNEHGKQPCSTVNRRGVAFPIPPTSLVPPVHVPRPTWGASHVQTRAGEIGLTATHRLSNAPFYRPRRGRPAPPTVPVPSKARRGRYDLVAAHDLVPRDLAPHTI